jgi:hypothetical protein
MGSSVQNELVLIQEHVMEMARARVFRGHAAARSVYLFYCLRVAINDSPTRGLKRGVVMSSSTSTKLIAECCELSIRGVQKANKWLTDQLIIEMAGDEVAIRSFDADSEAWRIKKLSELSSLKNELSSRSGELSAGAIVPDLGKQ